MYLLFHMYAIGIQAETDGDLVDTDPDGNETAVPGEYIVVLKRDAPIVQTIQELVQKGGFFPNGIPRPFLNMTTRRRNLIGRRQFFTISGDDLLSLHVNSLRVLPSVATFAPNMKIRAFATNVSTPVPEPEQEMECTTQDVRMIWGLDRIDQRDSVQSSGSPQYIHGTHYGNGAGVNAYVVDSGLDYSNSEFGGRAVLGYSDPNMQSDRDDNGHGTHVAGTVGGDKYGVAKKVNIIGVKVLNWKGSGTSTTLIDGLAWVVRDYMAKGKPNSVVNLSLGVGGVSSAADAAVQEVIDSGITVVAAAGNEKQDACGVTPARVPDAITVGASDTEDHSASSFTNWGTCLDIWAPGRNIVSIEPSHRAVKSGTSMAAPHVTGVIARYLSTKMSAKPTPKEVANWLDGLSTKNKLTLDNDDIKTSPNKLLYVGCDEDWTVTHVTDDDDDNDTANHSGVPHVLIIICTWVVIQFIYLK